MKKLLSLIVVLASTLSAFAAADEARLLRFPAVGGDKIVFSYAGDLYSVSINGGKAERLTSHVGYEVFPRISPDGKTVAFTAQYDGNTEVYTIPVEGGEPFRVTYSANVDRDNIGDRMGPNNIVMCWTPDGKQIVYRSKWHTFSGLRGQLCQVDAKGGVPTEIPTSEGGFCSYSPDGKYLAMNRMFREFRTWKYYKGGQADEIWINKVGTTELEKITDNPNQDIFPMWIGDEIYYMSDRDRIMNLFCYNVKSKKTKKVTDFKEYDCKFPSYSKDYVVFENAGYIYKYDVKKAKCEKVNITLSTDAVYSRPEVKNLAGRFTSATMSPDGERVLVVSRGDIFSLPAKRGPVYNITRSSSSNEREIAWSPDGKNIAYFSDKDGEYQVYVAPSSDMENAVKMTSFTSGYPSSLQWSSDSKTIFFNTEKREVYALDLASKKLKKLLSDDKYNGFRGFTVSADGNWAAYSAAIDNAVTGVYLYNFANGKSYLVSSKWFDASSPMFSSDGKYLFYSSARQFRSQYSQVEWNAAYSVSSNLFIVPLAKSTPNPMLLGSDEYGSKPAQSESARKSGDKAAKASEQKAEAMVVDIEGIEERAVALPIEAGFVSPILCEGGKLYFRSFGARGAMPRGPLAGPSSAVKVLDLSTMKVSDGPKNMPLVLTPDHKKALVREGSKTYVTSFPMGGRLEDPIPADEMDMVIDRQAEWKQIYDETWRVFRDYFYVENMHGVDWKKIHDKYAVMLPDVKHRHDLTYLIGEMIGELAIGHAYVTSGETPEVPQVKTGLLGAKFSKSAEGFKVEKVYKGASWDESLRSPLYEAGVVAGENIVAINGIPAGKYGDIFAALVGKVGKTIALDVKGDKGVRKLYVKPVASETQLAYMDWVNANIEKVDKMSNGQIGYIHIPDMSVAGLDMFTKLFYPQLEKKALIIDDRMNGGGNVSPMILERLQREVYRMNMHRNGSNGTVPEATHYGPKVCLIDKYSSSDGDLFPYGFRQLGLGKLIGKRSWGGIVGISGSRPYLDGQDVRTPFFTSYSLEGEWIIEGHGVDPDIEVDINPFEDYKGKDAQLEKAVEVLKGELKNYKPLPGTPKAPVKNAKTWTK